MFTYWDNHRGCHGQIHEGDAKHVYQTQEEIQFQDFTLTPMDLIEVNHISIQSLQSLSLIYPNQITNLHKHPQHSKCT